MPALVAGLASVRRQPKKKFGLQSAGWPMQAEGVVLNVAKECIIRCFTFGSS
jgi:hypothetical protein